MLIHSSEVQRLQEFARLGPNASFQKLMHVLQNFHLFLPSGFGIDVEPDEPRTAEELAQIRKDLTEDLLHPSVDWNQSCGNNNYFQALRLRFRQEKTGRWYRLLNCGSGLRTASRFRFHTLEEAYHDSLFWFIAEGYRGGDESEFSAENIPVAVQAYQEAYLEITFDEIVENCKLVPSCPRSTTLLLPNLLNPGRPSPRFAAVTHIHSLLTQLKAEILDFSSVSPRDLEEIVAELLKSKGLYISLTKQTRDSGRDILARGELVPGEPTIIAVEVKHKAVVGIGDVRSALHANRHFPSLLVATSGRFSAGVIEESRASDNAFRLILRDGVALKQWINAWVGL